MVRLNQVYGAIAQQTLTQAYPPPGGARDPGTCQGGALLIHCIYILYFIFFLNVTRAQVKTRHEFGSAVNKADGADPFTSQNYFVPSSNCPNPMGPNPVVFPLL